MIREKRQHARARVDQACSIESSGSTDAIAATLRDISVGGAFVESSHAFPFGTELSLVVALPGEATPLRLSGTVRWSHGDGFGVQFGLLGARETFAITQLTKKVGQ
jgi:type IV pilus assembly protein PilZ